MIHSTKLGYPVIKSPIRSPASYIICTNNNLQKQWQKTVRVHYPQEFVLPLILQSGGGLPVNLNQICCFASSEVKFSDSDQFVQSKSPIQPYVILHVLPDLSDLNNLESKAY